MKKLSLKYFVVLLLIGCITVPSVVNAQNPIAKELPYTLDAQNTSFSIRYDKGYQPNLSEATQIITKLFAVNSYTALTAMPSMKDEMGMTHTLLKEYYNGIEVYGGEILVHERNGKLTSINGSFIPLANINTNTVIDAQAAKQIAIDSIRARQQRNGVNKPDSIFSVNPITIEKILSPRGGDKSRPEKYRIAYRVKVSSFIPHSSNFVIDATNGDVLLEIGNVAGSNANGTGSTYYNGTQPIVTDYTGSLYRLKETGANRNIGVYDLHGEEIGQYTSILADYFTNSDNTWSSGYYLKQVKINSTDDWGSFLDAKPDYFFKLKNNSGTVIYTSKIFSNQPPPKTFDVYTRCVSPPCTIEIYDEDPLVNDLLATIPVTLSNGSHNFTSSNNNIDYVIEYSGDPAVQVHWGIEKSLDYYRTEFQRYSFDGAGSKVYCYLNPSDLVGNNMPSGSYASADDYLVFGMGGYLTPVLGAADKPHIDLDCIGHEFTHMVVAHNGHGGLPYQGEPGALNESFADIFGTCIEFYANPSGANWLFSSDGFPSTVAPFCWRSLSSPNNGFYNPNYQFDLRAPDTYGGTHWGDPSSGNDHGHVHTNSGVQNFWFYLLANQNSGTMTGTNDIGYNYNVTCIGMDHAAQIAYRNLTTYLTSSATYYDAALGSINAAIDLYGVQSQEKSSVIQAWYAVGVVSNPNSYCSGTVTLTATSGTFNDGSGNSNYQNNNDCKWLLQPTGASSVTLTFSSFNTENGHDSVIVYDGSTTAASIIGKFTGTTLPGSVTSTTGAMLVRFKTDNATGAPGWIASYSSGTINGCSGTVTLNSSTGSVSDGSGTGNYANNSNCYWRISPPGAGSVIFTFAAFDVAVGDTVYVYNGTSNSSPLLGKYTGTSLPSVQTANTGSMFISFKTNSSSVAQGWNGTYSSTGSSYCNGTTSLTASSGTLEDGSGGNNYQNNLDCKWLINPTSATSITLDFLQFDIEPAAYNGLGIIYDFVKVYDGADENAPLLGTFVGYQLPSQIISSSGSLFLWFHTDGATVRPGWQLSYSSNTSSTCSGTQVLTASSGIFDDGSGAGNYANNMDCRWKIQPNNATSIVLNFTSFNLESNNDAVIVYNGPTTNSPILGSFTGSSLPPSITSTTGTLLVRMISNAAINQAGFAASYNANISPIGNYTITAYEYWYDGDYGNAVYVNTAPVYDLQLNTSLQAQNLSSGMHILNIRFLDNHERWSSVLSSFLIKNFDGTAQSKTITGYEYWYDTDYANKISQTVSPQQTLDLSAPLNMASLSDGMHILNIRFKDNGDFWSSVLSQFVIKYPGGNNANKHITEYEYWFDSNYANKVNQAVTPQISSIVNAGLDVASLTHGMHTLNIRFKDDGDFWSSVLSSFFIRNGTGVANVNKITAYRYWFDTAYTSITNVLLPTPVNPYDLVTNVNTASLSAGAHTVHFQFKDSINLWSGVTNDTFNNVVGPHANFIANDTTLCYSGTVIFTNLSTNATSYQWSFGDGATATTINPTHTYTSSGLYTVRLIAIGSGNLRDTLSLINHIRVTVPNVTVSSNITICPGGSTTLVASGGTSYLWYPSTGLNTTSAVSVTASPAANTIYYVIGTDQYGCLDTAQSTVSVSNIVTVSINPPATTICSGNSATLSASGADTYTWSPSTGLNAVNGATVSASPGAPITYIVTGNSSCGSDTESITVNVNQTPIANAGNDTSICEGSMVNLLASGGLTYLWNNGLTTALNSVSPSSHTTYIVTVTSNNCSATDTVSVAVNPLPLVALTDTSICIGSSILLDAGNTGSTYTWQDGATTQTYAVSSGGTYSVTVTNSYGCNETASAVVIANSTLNVQISDTSICQGQSIILNAGFPGASYSWSTNATSQTITILTGNTYSVTVTHPSGCTGTDASVVTVNANPTASAGNDVSICNGEHITLTAMGGTNYSWNNAANTSTNNVSPTSSTTYYVTVTDNNSCSATDSVSVIVNQLPTVSLDTISTVCVNAGLMPLTGGLPAGGVYAGVGVSGGNFNPTTAGVGSHLVTYTYTDANGCHDSAQITVTVNNCTGLQNKEEQSTISLFPNPTAGLVSIAIVDVGNTQLKIKISNALGQELNSDTYPVTNSFFTKYDMSLFASGIYYFKIMVNDKVRVFDVVLEK